MLESRKVVTPRWPDPQWIHETTGNNFMAWHSWVETLLRAAVRIRDFTPMLPLPGGVEGMLSTNAVYAMLLGYAAECALKGHWVKAKEKVVSGGRYQRIKGAGDHELGKLARIVGPKAGLAFTPDEISILDRLSAFILYGGRYPIAITPGQMQPVRGLDGEKQVPHVFLLKDFYAAERLINRLATSLIPFPWRSPLPYPPVEE